MRAEEIVDYLEQALEIEHKLVTSASLSTTCGISSATACSALKEYLSKGSRRADASLTAWYVVSGLKLDSESKCFELVNQYDLDSTMKLYAAEAKSLLYGLQCGDTKNFRSLWAYSQGGAAAQRRPLVVPPSDGIRGRPPESKRSLEPSAPRPGESASSVAKAAALQTVPPAVLRASAAPAASSNGLKAKELCLTGSGSEAAGSQHSKKTAVAVAPAAASVPHTADAAAGIKPALASTAAASKPALGSGKRAGKPAGLFSMVTAKSTSQHTGCKPERHSPELVASPQPSSSSAATSSAGSGLETRVGTATDVAAVELDRKACGGTSRAAAAAAAAAEVLKKESEEKEENKGHSDDEALVIPSSQSPQQSPSSDEESGSGRVIFKKKRAAAAASVKGAAKMKKSRRLSSDDEDVGEKCSDIPDIDLQKEPGMLRPSSPESPARSATTTVGSSHTAVTERGRAASHRELKETSYVDDDGFLVTEKSWVNVSDEPVASTADSAAASATNAVKEVGRTHQAVTTAAATSVTAESNSDDHKKAGHPKKKGALSSGKQKSLLSFFTKP